MKQITHVRPLSFLHLFFPQLITSWAVFWVSWLVGLGGSRELVFVVGESLAGDGLTWTFAVIIPVNALVGVLGLAAFAAVYNRYNRGFLTLDVELTPGSGANPDAWLLAGVRPRSFGGLFVPLLALGVVNMAGALGLSSVLGFAAAFFGVEPAPDVLLLNGLVGALFVAGIVVLGGMLAAVIYNRVAAGGEGVRLRMTVRDHGLVLNRFDLKTIHYALPSFLALTVVTVVLELLLGVLEGGDLTADALFSVGAAIPTLWLLPALYNLLAGRGGIGLKLKKREF
jgi:hypothetical protein